MNRWIVATRPNTLIASASPVLIGTSLAHARGLFAFWIFLFTLLTGLGIQITCNMANDYFDFLKGADTPDRKGPVRVTQSGLASLSVAKQMTLIFLLSTTAFGIPLMIRGGWIICLLVPLALAFAFAYTAGPFPISYLGLGEFFVLIFFGPVATGCTYYLQTLHWDLLPFIAGLSPGLISCGILIINHIRDVDEDKKSKKKTLVTRFGTAFGKWEYTMVITAALVIPFFLSTPHSFTLRHPLKHPFALLLLLCALPATTLIWSLFKNSNPYAYNSLLANTGKLLALFTFIFIFSWHL